MQPLRPRMEREDSLAKTPRREPAESSSRFVLVMPAPKPGVNRTAILVVREDNALPDERALLNKTLAGVGPDNALARTAESTDVVVSRVMRIFDPPPEPRGGAYPYHARRVHEVVRAPELRPHDSPPAAPRAPAEVPGASIETEKESTSAVFCRAGAEREAPALDVTQPGITGETERESGVLGSDALEPAPALPRTRAGLHASFTALGAVVVSACVYLATSSFVERAPSERAPGSPIGKVAARDAESNVKASQLPSAATHASASGDHGPSITTIAAETRPMPRYLTLTGTLAADLESNVAADVAGKVIELPVDRGSHVHVGDVLAVLDRRSADLSSREATTAVELARVRSQLARGNCERAEGLRRSGAIGEVEFERAKTECETAKLSVDAAQLRSAAARKSVDDAVIRAPFAGVVSERLVERGEYLQPQSPVVHVVATNPLRLRLSVPQQLVSSLQPNLPVELQVSAYPERWFPATLRYFSAALRERTRDLLVEATVPNAEQKLRPGMFARARVVMPNSPATAVPEASVRIDGELARLFVARQGRLEERIVELGARDAEWVEVRRGISAGEAVVSPFTLEAKDGAPVAQ